MTGPLHLTLNWVEQGLLPDYVVRAGIRQLLRQRLEEIHAADPGAACEAAEAFIATLPASPVAPLPELANAQHYELPPAFFAPILGPQRKYSCCLWSPAVRTLAEAETAALAATCERAQLADGQEILELGCGWGSLSLWMAHRYPAARITAVSNSAAQRAYIEGEAERMRLINLRVITADMNHFSPEQSFDRVVSVEMFEHLRNWPEAFRRVASWLRPGGRFFLHVFAHRATPYAFEPRDDTDWMSRHFFSGGMMPSDDLAPRFQEHLRLVQRWRWDGRHYERTANAWLARMDGARHTLWPILEATYGAAEAPRWWMRWRLFFLSCAELFGYEHGREWWVSHYLFEPRA